MRIGIIGAGEAGRTLARLFANAGHDIAIAQTPSAHSLRASESPLEACGRATWAAEAARYGDVVVLAIPLGRYRDLPVEALRGKTVIDTTNYDRQRDGAVPELDVERSATSSELIQQRLDGAYVVKAFNTLRWGGLQKGGPPEDVRGRYGIAVSGDQPHAKHQVIALIVQLGFEPVDAGSLADGGRKHQPGTDGYAANLNAAELRTRLGIFGTPSQP